MKRICIHAIEDQISKFSIEITSLQFRKNCKLNTLKFHYQCPYSLIKALVILKKVDLIFSLNSAGIHWLSRNVEKSKQKDNQHLWVPKVPNITGIKYEQNKEFHSKFPEDTWRRSWRYSSWNTVRKTTEDDASTKESLIIYFAITGIIIVPMKNNLKYFILVSFLYLMKKKDFEYKPDQNQLRNYQVSMKPKINLVFKYKGMLKSSLLNPFPKIWPDIRIFLISSSSVWEIFSIPMCHFLNDIF